MGLGRLFFCSFILPPGTSSQRDKGRVEELEKSWWGIPVWTTEGGIRLASHLRQVSIRDVLGRLRPGGSHRNYRKSEVETIIYLYRKLLALLLI